MKTKLKINWLPVMALALGTGMALATQTVTAKDSTLATFHVSDEQPTYYQTSASAPAGCGQGEEEACEIVTSLTPDASGRIAKGPAVSETKWRDQ